MWQLCWTEESLKTLPFLFLSQSFEYARKTVHTTLVQNKFFLNLMVDLFTSCNKTTVWKSFVCSSLLYLSEKYPMLFIPRSQLFKNFFNSRITCTPCSSLQNTKKIICVTLEFLLGTNLLVENMLHYTSIMNWSDGKPLYKLQDRRKIERILHKPTFFMRIC